MNRKFANKLKLTRNIAGEITREGKYTIGPSGDRAAESVIRILEQGDREISRDHVVTLLTGSAGTTEEGSREHFFEGLGLVPGVRDYLRDNADAIADRVIQMMETGL